MINFNTKGSKESIIAEIKEKINVTQIGAIIFMASTKYDFTELSLEIQKEFPDSENIGCTTTGELSNNGLLTGTISISIFPKSIGKISSVLVEEIGEIPIIYYKNVKEAISKSGINFTNPKGICFSLSTGLNSGEEKFLSVIDSLFLEKKLALIGGSAGDDLKFKETFVSHNGKVSNHATACLFINSDKFKVYKENIFVPSKRRMQVTKASVQERTVTEFDGIKASKRYAELLGVSESKLAENFGSNPLGQRQGQEIFIRSPYAVNPDGSITFYSQLYPGGIVEILNLVPNLEENFRNTILKLKKDFKKIDAIFGVNCILRTLQFQNDNIDKKFCKILSEGTKNLCGFTSYGEQFGSKEGYIHLNQTLTIAVYGDRK